MEEKWLAQNYWRIDHYLSSLNFLPFSNCLVSTFSLTQYKNKHQNTLHLKRVSCKQHMITYCFHLQSDNFCLSINVSFIKIIGVIGYASIISFFSIYSICPIFPFPFILPSFGLRIFLALHFISKIGILAKPLCCFCGCCRIENMHH